MNNFQLNNTSVYLGGQCKWDIVLGNYNGQIYVQGFQLTPLSDNIPFNKRGSIDHLNEDHSYTLKKYCQDIKENFWSVVPDLNQKINRIPSNQSSGDSEVCYSDNSFAAGTRRSSCYPVYHKQFECLQPVWLEQLGEGEHLKFSFNLISGTKETQKVLGYKSFYLDYITTNNKVEEEVFKFHNKFVKYFYNWLKMINIIGRGNNKVLNVDLQKGIAQIDGVSTISGQKSNPISCDYVCDNLLSYERPNVETDYILTSLFKTHNIVTSQLFNFCFCFNIQDVVNPFFINQLNGKSISINCGVSIDNTQLERRTSYTNYEFVRKSVYDPYVFLNNLSISSTGKPSKDYTVKYDYNNEHDVTKFNVLDYLHDNVILDIKDINKIAQHIIHWDFVDHNQNIFNLYDGYSGLNSFDETDWNLVGSEWNIKLFEFDKINETDIVSVDADPTKTNGALNWINPTKIIVVQNNPNTEIFNKILKYIKSPGCALYNDGLWTIDKSELKFDDEVSSLENFGLSFIKIWNETWFSGSSPFAADDWEEIYSTPDVNDKCIIYRNKNSNTILDHDLDHYVIVTNNIKWFSINTLSNITSSGTEFSKFKNYIDSTNKLITLSNNDLNFYGFGTELEIGKDDLDNECYYKSVSSKTYVYRKCGLLTPCLKTDSDYSLNYEYCQSVDDDTIYNIPSDPQDSEYGYFQDFEYRLMGDNRLLDVMSELNYTIEKDVSDERTVKDLIKQQLVITYNIDSTNTDLIDYIYNLYNITFKYEYKLETSIDTVVYKVKMILK